VLLLRVFVLPGGVCAGSNPTILHRDLKSDNLLVTQDWIVKVRTKKRQAASFFCRLRACMAPIDSCTTQLLAHVRSACICVYFLCLFLLCDRCLPFSVVQVADFGLTRFISEKKQMTQVGTPMWMAPEIIMGKKYTEKADVYAFGVILWEILTRLEPYEDKEPMQIVVEVVNEGLRPTLPPPFDSSPLVPLMKQCWDQDPEQRPSFEKVLERLLEIDARIPADDNSIAGIPGTSRPVIKHHQHAAVPATAPTTAAAAAAAAAHR